MSFIRRLKPSLGINADVSRKRILFLSSLRPGSGNAATATRIAHELQMSSKFIVDCVSVDKPLTELDSLLTSIHQYSAVIALHVYRAGNLLKSIYKDKLNDCLPPLILIFAGTDLHSCEPKWLPTMQYIIPFASGLVCFSDEWKKYVEITYKDILPSKITVIRQGVLISPAIFEPLPLTLNKKTIIWTGEIRSVKDPIFAIRFLSHLNNDDFHLILIGYEVDSALYESIHSSYSQMNLTFVGGQSQSFVQTLMRSSFAYINTSINEGMCLAMLEAMALGLPVLARRNIGNLSLVKHGKNGLLFDTPDEAVQCLFELDNNTKLRDSLILQAENYVKKYHSLANETKTYFNLFENLIR